ncbi:N-acetylmuramoyl-L-alanine amidase-like domain-containing protein [uncultured Muribaculum sp.]|uniref:N-acetylmuramoyl-L-alanine amidase-like domain-containing protein n=2 Tax=uncultured Muribaculum sp. TaxID=1918613 RepID=UPI002609288C|nr:N-acetylmuramoyl-L-alanine amidase-like domain-containing protein [uncultured Muribaculum sp.]
MQNIVDKSIKGIMILAGLVPAMSYAANTDEILFHNEQNDTIAINRLLSDGLEVVGNKTGNAKVLYFSEKFLNSPYVSGTLENESETLTVNIDELDCTTLVENALALAYTLGEGRTSWRDFVFNLQRLRYRGGEINGFSSRLHYISDFIIDNSYRGNIKDITSQLTGSDYTVKTIDYMTRHKDAYPALADSAQYAHMRKIESGYRSHRFPFIKSSKTGLRNLWQELQDGDVICITSKIPGLDVQHLGIVKKINGVPHLLHASSTAKKVIIDQTPLHEYLRKNRNASGIRVIRISN